MGAAVDTRDNLLQKDYLQTKSKGGTQIILLCPRCHSTYGQILCNAAELKNQRESQRLEKVQPKVSGKKTDKGPYPGLLTKFSELVFVPRKDYGKNNVF